MYELEQCESMHEDNYLTKAVAKIVSLGIPPCQASVARAAVCHKRVLHIRCGNYIGFLEQHSRSYCIARDQGNAC